MCKFVSSLPLLVISQFSQFCVITAHISAERHLSKISYENFYSPWPPLTFKTTIIFHVKPFFTSAHGPTVKLQYYLIVRKCHISSLSVLVKYEMTETFVMFFLYQAHQLYSRFSTRDSRLVYSKTLSNSKGYWIWQVRSLKKTDFS